MLLLLTAVEHVCEIWNVEPADPSDVDQISSPIPTLILAGEYDFTTPLRQGEIAAAGLSNAELLEVPSTGTQPWSTSAPAASWSISSNLQAVTAAVSPTSHPSSGVSRHATASDLWGDQRLRRRPTDRTIYSLTRILPTRHIANVDVFEVIAEPSRRAILAALLDSDRSVGEIVDQLPLSQPTVSKHLKVLRDGGFVSSEAAAQRRVYRLRPERFTELDQWLDPYRTTWAQRLDALDAHLDRMEDS